MPSKDLSKLKKKPDTDIETHEVLEVLNEYLEASKEKEGWFSGVKKLTNSKKATVLMSKIVGTVAAAVGLTSVAEDGTTQGIIASVAMGAIALVVTAYMSAQGKADGPGGKETMEKEAKNLATLELAKAVREKIKDLDAKKAKKKK